MIDRRKFARWFGCATLLLLTAFSTVRTEIAFSLARPSRSSLAILAQAQETQEKRLRIVGFSVPANAPDQDSEVHAKLRRWLRAESDSGPDEPALMRELLALLRDENAASMARMLSSEELNSPFGLEAMDRWLKQQPEEAAEWLAATAKPTDELALLLARHLVDAPTILDAYCERLADTTWREKVLIYSSLILASSAPERAITLAGRMEPGIGRKNVLSSVVNAWALNDAGSALAWLANVNDPFLRQRLLGAEAQAIAVTDPDLAAEWIGSSAAKDASRHEVVSEIVRTWASRAPAEAARWITTFGAGAVRDEALVFVAEQWIQSEPEQALRWIQALPENDRERVTNAVIETGGS